MLESIIAILGLVGGFGFGALKYWKYVKASKEIFDVVNVSKKAFEDGKLTADEQKAIFKEIMDIPKALGLTI